MHVKKNTLGKKLKLSKYVILFKNIIVIHDDISSFIGTIDHLCWLHWYLCWNFVSACEYTAYNSVQNI